MAIGVAMIGSGIFARAQHLVSNKLSQSVDIPSTFLTLSQPAIEACPLLSLKAIYSRTHSSAQKLAADAAASSDIAIYSDDVEDQDAGKTYRDLLGRSDIQAVTIALPIPLQPPYIRAALAAGKHVLSEKPIAPTLSDAHSLLAFYHSAACPEHATWSVAENFRFLDSFLWGAEKVREMGRVLGFRVNMFTNVMPGKTEWRKHPSYQGGFLLDGAVHFIAGLRLLLTPSQSTTYPASTSPTADTLTSLSALTALLRPHLPPVDTVDSILRTSNDITGTFSVSFGTTFPRGSSWHIACEKGGVTVAGGSVIIEDSEGQMLEKKSFPDEKGGVGVEVRTWAEGIAPGSAEGGRKHDPRLRPEEALRDLDILDKMLRSGETGGLPQEIAISVE
ncbi:MAG: hypothetical protein M1819_005087 [Sarea resinae]|nr:MAG: hypothetical protein M1819_005087 [Sarea resinae]